MLKDYHLSQHHDSGDNFLRLPSNCLKSDRVLQVYVSGKGIAMKTGSWKTGNGPLSLSDDSQAGGQLND